MSKSRHDVRVATTDAAVDVVTAGDAVSGAIPSPCSTQASLSSSPWPVHSSASLLGGAPCVYITHADGVYVLRATRSGKLILTK